MPQQESSHRFDYAVLWAYSGVDRYNNVTVSSPTEIRVRWVQGRAKTVDAQSAPIRIDATAVVGEEIAEGSILWHGRLAELPSAPTSLFSVESYNETHDIKGRQIARTVSLVKFGGSLPTVV